MHRTFELYIHIAQVSQPLPALLPISAWIQCNSAKLPVSGVGSRVAHELHVRGVNCTGCCEHHGFTFELSSLHTRSQFFAWLKRSISSLECWEDNARTPFDVCVCRIAASEWFQGLSTVVSLFGTVLFGAGNHSTDSMLNTSENERDDD